MDKSRKTRLAQQIKDEVSYQLKRFAMAKSREDFINRLVEVLIPALRHHYRIALGTLNKRTDQVDKWQTQLDGYLDQFADRLQEVTKAKELNRRKAVEQAVKELFEHDDARVRGESKVFQQTYKVKTLIPLTKQVQEQFLARVWEIVDMYFPS